MMSCHDRLVDTPLTSAVLYFGSCFRTLCPDRSGLQVLTGGTGELGGKIGVDLTDNRMLVNNSLLLCLLPLA